MRLRVLVAVGLLAAAVWAPRARAAEATVEYQGPPLTAGRERVPEGVVPTELSLEKAIELAIQYNPQVDSAFAGVKVADSQVAQAVSLLAARLDVTTSRVTPVNLPSFSFQNPATTWQTDFSLSQPLYTGGALSAGVAAAQSFRKGAAGTYYRTQQQTAFAARASYCAVLTAEEGVNVAQQVVDSAMETLRVARLRYQAGVAPQFDVLSAEARVARVDQGLIAARVQRDIACAQLSTVLGVSIPIGTQLTAPRLVTYTEGDFETLREEALAHRPDLVAAEGAVAVARAQLGIAKAAKQPTVAAAMSYSLRPNTTVSGDLFGQPGTDIVVSQNSGAIALSANWSLFNAGQVEGEINQARSQLRQAEDGLTGLKQQVELDVRSAYVSVSAATAQVAAAQKEVAQAQEAFRVATIRYEEGVGTSVEILSAQADLADAKTRLNQANFGLNLAVAQLDLALGRSVIATATPQGTG